MLYRGPRVAGADYFDEYAEADADILHGMGAVDFDRVTQHIDAQGVIVSQISCHGTPNGGGCGRKQNMTITWEELFYVANNGPGRPLILPEGWARSEENLDLYVQVACARCNGGVFAVHFTPDEARRLLMQAESSGFVTQPMVAEWAQKVNAVAASRR